MDWVLISVLSIGGRKEKEAFEVLKRNGKTVLEMAKEFEKLVTTFFFERNVAKAEAIGKHICQFESKADNERRRFARNLQEGAFLPVMRGDLAELAERLDKVADAIEEATLAILLREKLAGVLAKAEMRKKDVKVIKEDLSKISRIAIKTTEVLQNSINLLTSDIGAAISKADEVEKLEHESDIVEHGLITELYAIEKLLDPVSVVQLKEIVEKIGDISDRAEDTSDIVSVLAYMRV